MDYLETHPSKYFIFAKDHPDSLPNFNSKLSVKDKELVIRSTYDILKKLNRNVDGQWLVTFAQLAPNNGHVKQYLESTYQLIKSEIHTNRMFDVTGHYLHIVESLPQMESWSRLTFPEANKYRLPQHQSVKETLVNWIVSTRGVYDMFIFCLLYRNFLGVRDE